jgi:DNA-binding response OmpR family regulator
VGEGTLASVLRILLVSDRGSTEVLPALADIPIDVKTAELSVGVVAEIRALEGDALVVDAADNPGQAHAVLCALEEHRPEVPVVAVIERRDLDRFSWDAVADALLFPGAPEAEIRVRLAMARRRLTGAEAAVVRLGPIALDTDAFRATVDGRALDLTFKEFELLRYLAERPGRAFTRPTLLREVWGFAFYGGTRTVDVHIRRLRSKLGPAFEHVIETVRGVGYRASDER